jgi:hypothetical protein
VAKILLDYFMPISVVEPIPAASTAFLKQVCVVAKPKAGQEGNVGTIFLCTSTAQVAARTDNENCDQLFAAGMSKVYLLLADDLDIADALETEAGEFYTVLISDDFVDEDLETVNVPAVAASKKIQDILYTAKTAGADGNDIEITYDDSKNDGSAEVTSVTDGAITVAIEAGVTTAQAIADAIEADEDADALVSVAVDAGDETDPQTAETSVALENGADVTTQAGDVDLGSFQGVVGYSTDDADVAANFAALERHCGFYEGAGGNGAASMFYAFGKLLSNLSDWKNQQYIAMPEDDQIESLGEANTLFDDRVSFVISDEEFGQRLALFTAGGKAIVAPYISKNLRVDMQSRALTWISANQPQFTRTNAALLEQRLQEDVINQKYIATQWIEKGVVSVDLVQDNFVANAEINISEPTAMWRVFGNMQSTL